MKKNFLIIFSILSFSNFALAETKSATNPLTKLKSYKTTYFAEANDTITTKIEHHANQEEIDKLEQEKNDTIVQDLVAAVDHLKEQKKWDPELLSEVVRVSSLLEKNDPSGAVGSILLPLYKKDKKLLLKEINKLTKKEAKDLEDSIKSEEKIIKKGNG